MTNLADIDTQELEIAKLTEKWGWAVPTKEVRDIAAMSLRFASVLSGEALVELGAITETKLDGLLARKPKNVPTLEWIAQTDPQIRPLIDKIMALRTGHAYYDLLKGLTVHAAMSDHAVQAKCDELDAVVMTIEERSAVVVFSTYRGMMSYQSEGREKRLTDVIRKRVGVLEILVAVGKRDEVISTLSSAKNKEKGSDYGVSESMWFGANATEKSEKQIVKVIDYCLSNRVTDIAFEPIRGGGARLYMRRFRDMVAIPVESQLSPQEAIDIVNLLMAKSNANPKAETVRDPRDGQIPYRSTAGDAYMRCSFIPLNHPGEELMSVSIRLFTRTEAAIDLQRLSIAEEVRRQITRASIATKGFVLVVGGTNTGKSTTIAGAIGENRKHFGDRRKRLSLEKPVERFLPGITQINVPVYLENGFNFLLEAIKRHDPDVIWIGEILGKVTAEVCVAAAISGHLVFSTTHATNTLVGFDSVSKYIEESKRYQYIEALSLIVGQEMVKEVCPCCREIGAPTAQDIEAFENHKVMEGVDVPLPESVVHANPKGCGYVDPDDSLRRCIDGYVGILPVNEVLPVTAKVKAAMMAMLSNVVVVDGVNQREVIAKARTSTLFSSAMVLVNEHKVELEEALL